MDPKGLFSSWEHSPITIMPMCLAPDNTRVIMAWIGLEWFLRFTWAGWQGKYRTTGINFMEIQQQFYWHFNYSPSPSRQEKAFVKSRKLQINIEFMAVPEIIFNLQNIIDFNFFVCTFAWNVLVNTVWRRPRLPRLLSLQGSVFQLSELVTSLLFSQMDCEGRNHTIVFILSPSVVFFSGDKNI